MKKSLLFLLLLIFGHIATAQQYKSHTVVKGENVYRIAKRYNTTPEAIYKINPTAKDGIKEGQILAIPVTDDQEYKTHIVEKGDTVFSLSKKYNVSQEAIYILNPEAIRGINVGQILRVGKVEKKDTKPIDGTDENGKNSVLDSLKIVEEGPKIVRYITHKVKRKETLYGIAKKYNVTVEDIKRQNKRLYAEQIRKKDKIRIPVFDTSYVPTVPVGVDSVSSRITTTTKYRIRPKETKFGIARRHGITISQLEQLNPGMNPDFPIGMEITVPTTIFVSLKDSIQPGFELYKVKPKETIFSILKRTGISSDSLLHMNPYLREGLKAGMVITIPKDTIAVEVEEGQYLDLSSKLYNFKPKKIAVMLPFSLDTLNFEAIQTTEEYLKKKQSLRIALDLYSGILIAVDSAKTKGIPTELNVYDTEKNNNKKHIEKLLSEHSFDSTDAVIGPLYQKNLEIVASRLKQHNTPVFSPASRKESGIYDNFFQTRPTDVMLQDKIIAFIEKDSTDKNIVLIIQQGKKYEKVKEKLMSKFPKAKVARIEEGNYLYEVHLNKVLVENKPNWIILESDDVAMLSNVIPLLNAKTDSHQITLFTSDKNSAYDNDSVKNENLSKLHLHYPSGYKEFDEKEEDTGKSVTPFVKRYKKEYGIEPNNWAVRGFDIAYDILLRLGAADDLYRGVSFNGTTEYVETKFNYEKKPLGGYYNDATYIIKFDDDLKLSIVE
ncbi:LysM peptidoglycan-binding domain-containing protein [Aquimarina sp. U1-2]|uniref:LysM peptidoglycan-binding domain-containing protein n=1 Tax=Aquimarina sp. U1-2 TaxID=2823141 RepID=UPI001AECF092|nr:LysM peptidoglycan-binding domain-containing protein [Aquimarina sp. U1-2]MBP2830611.1 LysM peptidoglycan-binding domain-containing protein [Aquimarina sp. U1-2]